MERGVIDAMEYSYPSNDLTEGYYTLAKYYTVPGIHQPTSSQDIYINMDSWNALPEDLQQVFYLAANENILSTWISTSMLDIDAMQFYKENGNELVRMTDETIVTLIDWANKYMDDLSKDDPFFAKVRASQIEFGKIWFPYKEMLEIPYPDLSGY
jgi:TRAP-type mannitol/chloroaromatic compound transport system substrate-binding protein